MASGQLRPAARAVTPGLSVTAVTAGPQWLPRRAGNCSANLVARSADRLEALAGRLGPQAHALPAGLSTLGLVAKSVPEQEIDLVEVDVAAVVDLCSRFLPGMVERHRGAVLNVASAPSSDNSA